MLNNCVAFLFFSTKLQLPGIEPYMATTMRLWLQREDLLIEVNTSISPSSALGVSIEGEQKQEYCMYAGAESSIDKMEEELNQQMMEKDYGKTINIIDGLNL